MKKSIFFASAFTLAVALPVVLHSSKAFSAVPMQALATATKLPLKAGTVLKKGMKLASPSGNHILVVGDDGNLIVTDKSGGYVWGTDQVIPNFRGADRVEFRSNGRLISYNNNGEEIWIAAVTRLDPKAILTVTDDGILQLLTDDEILWASKGAVGSLKPPSLPKPTTTNTPEFDSNKYYRFTSPFIGKGKSLNVTNGMEDYPVHFAKSEANFKGKMGQFWKIEKLSDGYYGIKSLFRGYQRIKGISLAIDTREVDGYNVYNSSPSDQFAPDPVNFSPESEAAAKAWKIEKSSNGYYRLTNKFFGEGRSLGIVNDGQKNKVRLVQTGKSTSQAWIITEIPILAKSMAPKPTAPKPTAPKPTAPKPTAPKPTAPKSTTPKSTTPKSTTPNTSIGAGLTKEQLPPPPTGGLTVQNFRSYAAFDKPIDAKKPDDAHALLSVAVYFITNEARVKQGKSVIPYHPLLTNAAINYAEEMVTKDFFDHDHPSDPAQRTPTDRGKLAGIKNAQIAENIHMGSITMHTYLSLAQSIVDGWMSSPGHRANILSDDSRGLGCGVWLYRARNFKNMLAVKAVQKFQQFEDVKE